MFDKLGDMLNECLEKGEIPQNPPKRKYYRESTDENKSFVQGDDFTTEEVVAEKEPITLPRDVEQALSLLGLGSDTKAGQFTANTEEVLPIPSLSEVRASYAQLLKEAHPDTAQEEITSAQAAQRIDELTKAFNKVRDCYKKLGIMG